MRRKFMVTLQIVLGVTIIYQTYLLVECQGSCFDYVAYMCQDCITPRCFDYGCFQGPLYWTGDCCCMKPESDDRCCYYRCYAYFCISYDPFYWYHCIVLNEVYRDYYVDFYPAECDKQSGLCVTPIPAPSPPPDGI
jgi:hypothetical protein